MLGRASSTQLAYPYSLLTMLMCVCGHYLFILFVIEVKSQYQNLGHN